MGRAISIRSAIVLLGALALASALALHWILFFERRDSVARGVRLVVFGPSSWDTLIPDASPALLDAAVAPVDTAFRKRHPEVIAIDHDSRGPISDGVARLRNAIVARDQVDVVLCAANPLNTSYARLGLVAPLDPLIARIGSRFRADAIANLSAGGRVWAAPLSVVNLSTFFYDRDLFDRLGIAPPASFSDFLAIRPPLLRAGVIPIVHQGRNAWMWTPWLFSALVQADPDGFRQKLRAIMAGRGRFTDAPIVTALERTKAWTDDGLLDPQSGELDEEGMKAAFLGGRAAMFFGGTWDLPGIRANARFHWGVFPFPKLDGLPGRPRPFGGAESGLCLAKASPHPALAAAYIDFVTQDRNAGRLFAPQRPFATSHRAITGVAGPMQDALRRQLPAEKPLDWMLMPEVNEIIQREVQSMMAGNETPAETAAAMQRRFDALVANGLIDPAAIGAEQ